jgi:4-amino-4-deoxy-L-arabinose transferase-like glycosyltransferase
MRNKIVIRQLLFLGVIILAVLLRFMLPGVSPTGLYTDEAAYGYNAYSILHTGKDEFGMQFPFAFKSFGDYKTPLFIYFTIPFVWLGGLNEISIRYASATASLLLVIVIYFLSYELFHKRRIALLSAWSAAVLPFALQFGRMAHENNLSTLLISSGALCFIKAGRKKYLLPVSFFCFGLSLYAYHDARAFIPFFFLILGILYYRYIHIGGKYLVLSVLVFILTLLPLLSLLHTPEAWTRPKYTSLLADKGIIAETEQARREDQLSQSSIGRMYHNKLTEYSLKLIQNYFSHFSPDFLFFTGDQVKTQHVQDNGLIYVTLIPFILAGFIWTIRQRTTESYLLVAWLAIAPIPSTLTKLAPSAGRLFTIVPAFSILIGVGLMYLYMYIKGKRYTIVGVFFLLFIVHISFYLHSYYVNTPFRYAKDWYYGQREMMEIVKERQDNYKTIWFSKQASRYIFALVYLQYPPEKYQPQADLSGLDEFGFGWISKFDKYIFSDLPINPRDYPDTLYIGQRGNFSISVSKPLYVMNYPDGQEAFIIADKTSFIQ